MLMRWKWFREFMNNATDEELDLDDKGKPKPKQEYHIPNGLTYKVTGNFILPFPNSNLKMGYNGGVPQEFLAEVNEAVRNYLLDKVVNVQVSYDSTAKTLNVSIDPQLHYRD